MLLRGFCGALLDPDLLFLASSVKKARKTTKKARTLSLLRTPNMLGEERKMLKKARTPLQKKASKFQRARKRRLGGSFFLAGLCRVVRGSAGFSEFSECSPYACDPGELLDVAYPGTFQCFPCVSKQCPADGVWRIGRGGSPDRVLKTRFTPSESSAGHGLPPQRAPKQCPANGVRRVL